MNPALSCCRRLFRWLVLRLYYGWPWYRVGPVWRWADRTRETMISRGHTGWKGPR